MTPFRFLRLVSAGFAAVLSLVSTAGPGAAAPLANVTQIVTGYDHSCALLTNGTVRCWGNNDLGQVGDGTNTRRLRPVAVKAVSGAGQLKNVVQLATVGGHTCARLTGGEVRCWGKNTGGQLGNNTTNNSTRPVVVLNSAGNGPLEDAVQLTAGSGHTCIRLQNGQARCWGWNDEGQQGINNNTNRPLPGPVLSEAGTAPLNGIKNIIAAGGSRTCASFTTGIARCWGWGGISGQIGDGTTFSRDLPVKVTKLENSQQLTQVAEMAPGGTIHTCARLTTGGARCWGHNQDGQLGDGTAGQRLRAVIVSTAAGPLMNIEQMAAGGAHSCALLTNGTARCWGLNDAGQIGDGTTTTRLRPVVVKGETGNAALTKIAQISAAGRFPVDCCQLTGGVHHTCALMDNGQVRCWGNNSFGQLGDGTRQNRNRPRLVQN